MIDDEKRKRKYVDIPATNSNLGQNLSVLNSIMAEGGANPTQTKRIQALNAATAPTTAPVTRPQPALGDKVFTDPGGAGTLTLHGPQQSDRRPAMPPPQSGYERLQAMSPTQQVTTTTKRGGLQFQGSAEDALKFNDPAFNRTAESDQANAQQRIQFLNRQGFRRVDPNALPAGIGWKERTQYNVQRMENEGKLKELAFANQANLADPTRIAQAGLHTAQTAKTQQEFQAQQTENQMLGILSDPNASAKDTNRARQYFQGLKAKTETPMKPQVFQGAVIEERDPVTNHIISKQLPPTVFDFNTGTYSEAQPAQQYATPSQAYIDRMISNKGNPDYEAAYIKRFGKLPY